MEFTDDDEGDCPVPAIVTEYHFVNEKDDPICFSVLPFRWDEDQILEAAEEQVFIYGEIDDGLQKIYKQVIAWNVQVIADDLQIQVLSKDKTWLKVRKPRKSYQETIRSMLITLECLSYLKMNPSSSEKSLWDHARKTFSHFEVSPCKDDLMVQKTIIQSMVERDETLLKAEVLAEILRSSSKRRSSNLMSIEDSPDEGVEDDQKSRSFNDGDDHDDDGHEVDQYDGHDHVCAICDNGGDLLCCEGECLRSFHATKSAGADSQCKTLGYTRAQVKAIQNFVCPNCLHKKHQCFVCGELGNSDKESGPEVFRCMLSTCGHFYHPGCVAKLLNPENNDEASSLEANISSGESFLCPVHKCRVCKQFENKEIKELQFAICRRCPKTYHSKCLPRKIAFEGSEDGKVEQRAWEDLIPNRILIYCLKHEIDSEIGTPERNHITFPGFGKGKTVMSPDSKKKKVLTKGKTEISPSEKKKPKKRRLYDVEREEHGALKSPKPSSLQKIPRDVTKMSKSKNDVALSSVLENGFELSELSLNEKLFDEAKSVSLSIEEPELDSPVTLNDEDAEKRKQKKCSSNIGTLEGKMVKSSVSKKKKVLAKRKKAEVPSFEKEKRPRKLIKLSSNEDWDGCSTSRQPLHPSSCLKEPKDFTNMPFLEKKSSLKDKTNFSPVIRTGLEHSMDDFNSYATWIDEDARKRILLLVKKSPSSALRVKDFLRKKQFSAAYLYGMKNIANTITHGKVEASVEAIRAALQKFENGSSIEDAKAVCGPDILNQMVIWKKKLKGYLGPLLHGLHDSSYGQDLEELRKVEEVVSRIHWYVTDGDMVVDVCCGTKDFSRLSKKKLNSTGKNCSFKNFDIFLPSKNSNWERRGWMAVQPKELQQGSQLVIWLDLPVGVNASHAHKLMDKALTFKPKILVLLSPKEIDRLDTQTEEAYDLIWEQKLAGQVYQVGSNEASRSQSAGRKQRPLILYLWSRSDWTSKHRMTAIKCGHYLNDLKMDHNLLDETIESENGGNHEVEDERVKSTKREELEEKPGRRSKEQLGERKRDLSLGHLPCHQAESPKPGGDRGKSRERNNERYQKARSYGQDERPGERSGSLEMGFHPRHGQVGPARTPERVQREKSRERSKLGLKRSYGNDERTGESRSLERGFRRHQSGPERSPKSRRTEKSEGRNEGYQSGWPYGRDETVLPTHQVEPERSPETSEREKQKETTKMKYHWTCLYSQDDQPEERTSAGPAESSLLHHHRHQSGPEAQTDSPVPINREKQAGERTEMRYHWSDLYAQDGQPEERVNRGPSEMRLSLPHRQSSHETLEELHYRAKVESGASDRRLSIPPGFPSHHQLLPGHMRSSPSLLERESQTWINEEMPRHPIHHEVNDFQMGSRYNYNNQHELGRRGRPLPSPSYGISSGSICYRMNLGSTQWVDPVVDQPWRMGDGGRMWEMSEQVGPAHLRPRYESSLPPEESHRAIISDANHYPFL